jgi:anti-sigma B factor antagonist
MHLRPSLHVRHDGGITFLEFRPAHVQFTEAAIKQIGAQFIEAIDQSPDVRFVVDFTGVEYMSSTVLGTLVSGLLKCQKKGGDLRLAGIEKELKQLFKLTGLHKVFKMCGTAAEAVKSFDQKA